MTENSETATADYALLVDRDDVVDYLAGAGILPRLAGSADEVEVIEVTAGNMNRVFIARGPLGSLAVKQAPPWVQVVGPDWPIDPVRIASEARAYELLAGLVPDSIPSTLPVDLDRYILVMEDLSDLDVLRDVLVRQITDVVAGTAPKPIDFPALGTVVGRFTAELSLATSAVGMPAAERAALIETAANPELCALTQAAVLEEPYRFDDHNHWIPELDSDVRALWVDDQLLAAVAGVREVFANRSEALIHGDLHSGSLMIGDRDGEQSIKIFDPEFSFVGPIGMDLGLFWANLTIASIAATHAGAPGLAAGRTSAIEASWREFVSVVAARWPSRIGAPDELGLDEWLGRVRSDAWRFAGVEGIRRVAGFSHAADITSLPADVIPAAYADLLSRARTWIITGADATSTAPAPASNEGTL